MIRHIFIAPIKPDTSDDLLESKIEEMCGLETAVEGIEGFAIGRNRALIAPFDAVVMTIDLIDKNAFDALLSCRLHQSISVSAAEAFDIDNFVFAQIEL